jgi:exodeoxyribonuclease V alpha subunit
VTAIDGDTPHLLLDDGRRVSTRGVQHKSLALACAATVHRAHGSEYPGVVLVDHRAHGALLDQRLLYTAVTRAREHLVLCTEHGAVPESAARDFPRRRVSGLAERIHRAHAARLAHATAVGRTESAGMVAAADAP